MNGIYWVGDVPFECKVSALNYASATNQQVSWDYYDSVFSSKDWSIPVEQTLAELYKQRAQQLRDNHEYLSLCFSGGADSTNVLHSFVDNGIFLDEIVMFRPSLFTASNTDKSSENIWSEIDYVAIPHLKNYIDAGKTSVRIIDLNEIVKEFVYNKEAVDSLRGLKYISATNILKNATFSRDHAWNARLLSGKPICHIIGMDKPVVSYDAGMYYFQFMDGSGLGNIATGTSGIVEMQSMQTLKPFYWSPDLPELLIKQCQTVKAASTMNIFMQMMLTNSRNKSQDYLRAIDRIVYPPVVNASADRFRVTKPSLGMLGVTDWVYTGIDPSAVIDAVGGIIDDIRSKIDDRFFVNNTNYYNTHAGEPAKTDKKTLKFFKNAQRYYI
jgi:hypothetical protein